MRKKAKPVGRYTVGAERLTGGELSSLAGGFSADSGWSSLFQAVVFAEATLIGADGAPTARYVKDDLDGAIRDQTQALKLNSNFAEAYGDRGNARMAKGDAEGALADLNHAIKLDGNLANVYLNRAFVLRERGNLIQALTDYDQTILLKAGFADPCGMRGLLKLRLGQEPEAPQDFEQCLRLKPGLKASLEGLVREQRLQLAAKP